MNDESDDLLTEKEGLMISAVARRHPHDEYRGRVGRRKVPVTSLESSDEGQGDLVEITLSSRVAAENTLASLSQKGLPITFMMERGMFRKDYS